MKLTPRAGVIGGFLTGLLFVFVIEPFSAAGRTALIVTATLVGALLGCAGRALTRRRRGG